VAPWFWCCFFTYASEAKANANRGGILVQLWCAQCHGVRPNELSADANAPSFSAIAGEASATEYTRSSPTFTSRRSSDCKMS
jgi:hypothetical protein